MTTEWTTEEKVIKAPVPPKTATYSPVSNRFLIESIGNELDRNHLTVTSRLYKTNYNEQQLYGRFRINTGDSELGWAVHFINSYDKTKPLTLAVGAEVLICSNGMIRDVGDVVVMRKHTGNIKEKLLEMIATSMNKLDKVFERIAKDRDALKKITIDPQTRAELIGRMYIEENIIQSRQLSLLKHEIDFPVYFKGNTAWDFYNHCTSAIKRSNCRHILDRHLKIHQFFKKNVLSRYRLNEKRNE